MFYYCSHLSAIKLRLTILSSNDGQKLKKNIARGTTDPEIDSVAWTKFANNMARLA